MSSSAQADLTKATIGTMPYIRSTIEPSPNLDFIATGITPDQNISVYQSAKYSFDTQTRLNKANSECVSAGSPQDILNLYQRGDQQCGWYYNEQTGRGSGYLSTAKGPVQGLDLQSPAPPYRLYYGNHNGVNSLQAAQKRFDKERCSSMTCSQAGNSTYKGVCGYCSTISKGVPIKADGTIKYPREPQMRCGGSLANLIVNAGDTSRCPAPPSQSFTTNLGIDPTTGQIAGVIRQSRLPNAGNCTINNISNTFSGACLQSALESQGCETEGSLSLALNGFNDAIKADIIINKQPNLGKYMETQPAFNLNRFLSASTMEEAQTQALALSQASSKGLSNTAQSSTDALAIDLCTTSGYYDDDYDFCGDLTDTTQRVNKWDITCLQKAFIAAGLTESGSMYPTSTKNNDAYNFYNTLDTWKDVKDYMKNIHTSIYQGGKQIERFTNPNTVSAPFSLQSENFTNRYIRFMGENKQLMIEDPNNTPKDPQSFLFVWKRGPNNTVIIMPVSNQSLSLYVVKENLKYNGRWYMIASAENNHNQFHVRPGTKGTNTVSFELASNPTLFLRHWNYYFYIDQTARDNHFPWDSSFRIHSGGKRQTQGFFDDISDPLYPGQQDAAMQGLGIGLDLPRVPFTQAGVEGYGTLHMNGVNVIMNYQTFPKPFPNATPGQWIDVALANYTMPQTQDVAITVNGSAGGWCNYAINTTVKYSYGRTYPLLEQIKNYKGITKFQNNELDGRPKTNTVPMKGSIPNIVKMVYTGYGFSFTMNSTPTTITIVRDPNAPFMRFEVLTDPAHIQDNKPLFTDIRCPEIAKITYTGVPLQYQNSETDILKIPGTRGAVVLDRSSIKINYIHSTAWKCGTFVFNIASIPPSSQTNPCPLLLVGTQEGYGYQCIAYGSTSGSMKFEVHTLSSNSSIVNKSPSISILPSQWYMACISEGVLTLYSINTQTYSVSPLSPPIALNVLSINIPNHIPPLIQIGSESSSINFSVAWLHLFDITINKIDPKVELIGYGPGGYETGLY